MSRSKAFAEILLRTLFSCSLSVTWPEVPGRRLGDVDRQGHCPHVANEFSARDRSRAGGYCPVALLARHVVMQESPPVKPATSNANLQGEAVQFLH